MPFSFRQVTISGATEGNEGTIMFVRELKNFMEEAGWTTTEDRTTEPGHVDGNTNIVMQSNGESGDYPTFYMVAVSGGSATAGQDYTYFRMTTAWDTAAHTMPASGVATNSFTTTMARLNTLSQEDYEVWMSGDAEALAIVTRQSPSTYDSVCIGRANSFMTTADNPFPLYLLSGSTSAVLIEDTTGASTRLIGGNPPFAFDSGNNTKTYQYTGISNNNQPYKVGAADSIFLALPAFLVYTEDIPSKQGILGTIRNAWRGAGTASDMYMEGILTASGTSGVQTYQAFTVSTTTSLIIRRS